MLAKLRTARVTALCPDISSLYWPTAPQSAGRIVVASLLIVRLRILLQAAASTGQLTEASQFGLLQLATGGMLHRVLPFGQELAGCFDRGGAPPVRTSGSAATSLPEAHGKVASSL